MKRQITGRSKNQGVEGQEVVTVQLPLPLLSTLAGVENGLFGLCVETGRQVLEVMMEQDRTGRDCTVADGEKFGWHPNTGLPLTACGFVHEGACGFFHQDVTTMNPNSINSYLANDMGY